MSVVVMVALVGMMWIGLCVLVIALCVSAKEGDGEEATLVPDTVLRPRRRRLRRSAPALS